MPLSGLCNPGSARQLVDAGTTRPGKQRRVQRDRRTGAREAAAERPRHLGRSGRMISASLEIDLPPEVDPLIEVNDMRRVDFSCHPSEPVKVLADWSQAVHCLICGTPARVETA